ncbi:hypothetical protein CAP48_19680 (plasmid) [Advenella sp. S44]|uniref:hypothetical protein n=1 Tax=Advenella sp. S44 TaxID=1982755 RepID=UPI000C298DFF|nr:hypothetical protein [Advenella sp. S44]PJX20017.1 hypothetical protein CAP48_19680 [Advenella sp. S44]
MKGQDILLLFKLASLEISERGNDYVDESNWQDWEIEDPYYPDDDMAFDLSQHTLPGLPESKSDIYKVRSLAKMTPISKAQVARSLARSPGLPESISDKYKVRSLARMTGISKSQVALSLARCYDVGLAEPQRLTEIPRINATALGEFVIYGLKYVFPAKRGALTRGIATAWAAPALKGSISSAGETPLVWPDARGNTKGMTLEPIHESVPIAVKQDVNLYKFLALTDSIRIGLARERAISSELLRNMLDI